MRSIECVVSEDDPDVAYVYLPKHPDPGAKGASARQVRLLDLVADYSGADVFFDFDTDGNLIGIEILG